MRCFHASLRPVHSRPVRPLFDDGWLVGQELVFIDVVTPRPHPDLLCVRASRAVCSRLLCRRPVVSPHTAMDPEAEFGLPVASITRIVKSRLPEGVQVGKDAKLAFSKAAGIFVLYLTACAGDICRDSKRSTIGVNDIFAALEEIEFEEYKEPLRVFLNRYRHEQQQKQAAALAEAESAKAKEADTASAAAGASSNDKMPAA